MSIRISQTIFFVLIIIALAGVINSSIALILGFLFSFFFTNPFLDETKKGIKHLLKIGVVGLGFGIFFKEAISSNVDSFGLLSVSVIGTVIVGLIVSRIIKLPKQLGFLVTSGTAICGGSAIAAVSPVIKADPKWVSVALAVVFALNSVALLIFPPIGHLLEMTQNQFGLWCAIAIHDTSSVVGASMSYGDEALKVATTLKLSRSLWVIPLAIFTTFIFKKKGEKVVIPYFIVGFMLAVIINSTGIMSPTITSFIVLVSKRLLVVTLFLIGANLSLKDLKVIGAKPFIFGMGLWILISVSSLTYILLYKP